MPLTPTDGGPARPFPPKARAVAMTVNLLRDSRAAGRRGGLEWVSIDEVATGLLRRTGERCPWSRSGHERDSSRRHRAKAAPASKGRPTTGTSRNTSSDESAHAWIDSPKSPLRRSQARTWDTESIWGSDVPAPDGTTPTPFEAPERPLRGANLREGRRAFPVQHQALEPERNRHHFPARRSPRALRSPPPGCTTCRGRLAGPAGEGRLAGARGWPRPRPPGRNRPGPGGSNPSPARCCCGARVSGARPPRPVRALRPSRPGGRRHGRGRARHVAEAHGPRHLEVTQGGNLELSEVRVGGQLPGRPSGLVEHRECERVAEPRRQRFDLFAELDGSRIRPSSTAATSMKASSVATSQRSPSARRRRMPSWPASRRVCGSAKATGQDLPAVVSHPATTPRGSRVRGVSSYASECRPLCR